MLFLKTLNMKNLSQVLFVVIGLVLFQCSPKVVKQTTVKEYNEDLSHLRPPIDSVSEETTDEIVKAPYTRPTYDNTQKLNALIDSLASDNLHKKIRYYTVQVYVGNSREEANEIRSKVYSIIPEETPKLEYSQPNFRVKVGKFESRLDAHKTFTTLKRSFPGAVMVSEKSYLK